MEKYVAYEYNYLIYCSCGCGKSLKKFDKYGNPRFYIPGHEKRDKLLTEKDIKKRLKGGKHKRTKNEKMSISYKNWLRGHKSEKFKKHLSELFHFEKHPQWRGGKCKVKGGHILVLVRDKKHPMYGKYARAHRLIIEKYLGRYLKSFEIIHHIDEDKWNNKLKNLCLTSESGHTNIHHNIRRIKKEGLYDKKLPFKIYLKCIKNYGKQITKFKKVI